MTNFPGDFGQAVPANPARLLPDPSGQSAGLVPKTNGAGGVAWGSDLTGGSAVNIIDAVVDYGVVGDGSTDNSTALIAMRDAIRAAPNTHHVIYFQPGVYHYVNNRWLWSVRSYEVLGHGCTFRCIRDDNDSPHVYNTRVISPGELWDDAGDVEYNPVADPYNGHLVASVAIGATSVTCSTVAEAGNFVAGERVLLYGWAQQEGGFPPNPRYFEYLTVAANGNATTGAVTFTAPVRFMYDSRWDEANDGSNYFWGPPRLMKLERTNYIHPVLAIFRGGSWLDNPNDTRGLGGQIFEPAADVLLIQDVTCVGFVPRTGRLTVLERCRVRDVIEADKVLDRLVIRDCVVEAQTGPEAFIEGTGILNLEIDRSVFHKPVRINARTWVCRRSTILGRPGWEWSTFRTFGWQVMSGRFEDCDFVNNHAALRQHLQLPDFTSITVASVASGVLSFTDNLTNRDKLYGQCGIGTMLLTRDGTKGGRITNVYNDGGVIKVEGDWLIEPAGADVLYFNEIMDFRADGCRFHGALAKTRTDVYRAYAGGLARYELTARDIKWTGEDVLNNFSRGRIVRIRASVDKVYSGASGTATLGFYDDDSGTGGNELLTIDLKTAGYREVNAIGKRLLGADAGDETDIGKWCHWLSTRIVGTATATATELPKLRVIVDVAAPAG